MHGFIQALEVRSVFLDRLNFLYQKPGRPPPNMGGGGGLRTFDQMVDQTSQTMADEYLPQQPEFQFRQFNNNRCPPTSDLSQAQDHWSYK